MNSSGMGCLSTIFNFLCICMLFTVGAFAYIDPSVMTYTIQVVAGVAVAAGAVITVFWRRAKKKVQKKLGIDENAKKEVEEDVVEIDDDN